MNNKKKIKALAKWSRRIAKKHAKVIAEFEEEKATDLIEGVRET